MLLILRFLALNGNHNTNYSTTVLDGLLAPTGALYVWMCYYYIYIQQLLLRFSKSLKQYQYDP